jgi:hypothetical protein
MSIIWPFAPTKLIRNRLEVRRVVFCLTTHSNSDSGDLHYSETLSCTVENVGQKFNTSQFAYDFPVVFPRYFPIWRHELCGASRKNLNTIILWGHRHKARVGQTSTPCHAVVSYYSGCTLPQSYDGLVKSAICSTTSLASRRRPSTHT